ncbi:MAG: serine hydrolase domain-containing protein [Bacteroidota bacterium]
MKSKSLLFPAILILISACTSSPPSDPKIEFDSLITTAMDKWEIPGLAVVVVKDDTVLMKGYGSQSFDISKPINAETYLQIASNSKLFAAYTIGMLVDDGLLNWDDPVIKHIPEFKVPDATVTNNVAIDDLLTHRSGLTEVALGGFQNPEYTIEDLLKELENTPLSTRFRARNHYSQAGMALLSEIVHRASGLSWEEFVQKRIFGPLEMKNSYTSTADFTEKVGNPAELENIMKPAVKSDGTVQMGSWQYIGSERLYAPAGGIISNMRDLSTWIQFRLNNGMKNGQQLISSDALHEIRKPRIPVDFSSFNMPWSCFHPSAELMDVGFGHFSFEHRGRRVISHNGGWMSSVIAIMPSESIGVGIFSNAWFSEPIPWASLGFVNALALDIFDHYLGHQEMDWSSKMAEIVTAAGSD